MPWNESHLYIRSDHRDPSTFDRDTIRTVAVSETEGIEAVVGKPPGRDYELTLSFLFAKWKAWTMETAKSWFKEHEHTAEVPEGYWPPITAGLKVRRFDPMKPTVGDLVGRTLGAAQELLNPIQVSGCNGECRRLHGAMGLPCSKILCRLSGGPAAAVNANSTGHFDPMKPTVGDLVGKNINDSRMQIDASSPPVVRRIDGRFDPRQPTVGDLTGLKSVRGHTSMGNIGIEPDDIAVHPRRIRECSR